MSIYRVIEPRVGQLHIREWRRRVLHIVGLLLVTLALCAIGLIALDSSGQPLPAKMFRGVWNALNLVTTLGDLTDLDEREKAFMMATMVAFLVLRDACIRVGPLRDVDELGELVGLGGVYRRRTRRLVLRGGGGR